MSLLCNNNIARFVYIFLQGSLYILYSLASFTFLLLPIVMLYVEFEHSFNWVELE